VYVSHYNTALSMVLFYACDAAQPGPGGNRIIAALWGYGGVRGWDESPTGFPPSLRKTSTG